MRRNNHTILIAFFVTWIALAFSEASYSRGIAVIVNPENPVETLSEHQIKKIFLGRLRRFPGTNSKMEVLDHKSGSSTYETFYTELIGFRISKLKRYRAAYLFSGKGLVPTVVDSQDDVKSKVGNHVSAIGYIDVNDIDPTIKVVYSWNDDSAE